MGRCAAMTLLVASATLPFDATAVAQREIPETGEGVDPPPGSQRPPETPVPPRAVSDPQSEEAATGEGTAAGQTDTGAAGTETDDTGEMTEGEGGAESLPSPPQLRVIVIDAAPHGVDPVVGRHVTERMRATAASMGYEVVSGADTVATAQRARMPFPPAPADLWQVTHAASAQRGAFAKVWAHQGRYVFELTIASADGAGPFFARGTSTAEDLHAVVEQLTREALPSPQTYDSEAAARYAAATGTPLTAEPPQPAFQPPPRVDRVTAAQRRASRRPKRRWDLALQTEGAFGTSSDFFYNHLVGVRLGFRVTHTLHLGLYGAYANLRGRGQRENNLLPMLQLTNRIRITSRSGLTVPIRAAVGYLPFNGPVIRLSAGLNIPVSERIELGVDLLVPTFWFLDSDVEISLNVGLELIYRL